MIQLIKQLFVLTKGGIVVFVVMSGLAGYAMGYNLEDDGSLFHLALTLIGLALVSAGSFALNQIQESEIDSKMKRTQSRPVASGWISKGEALGLSIVLSLMGVAALYLASPLAALLGFSTLVLYNGFYTLWWKRYWAFGAVPGAIPGAMPVVIGYAAIRPNIFSPDCVYLFLILFLWQMPHFWAIAIKLREDYEKGGIPVLPSVIGEKQTLFQIGLYTFVYVGLVVASPWFVPARYVYLFLAIPTALKLMWELMKFVKGANGDKGWLPFFIWTNLSVIVFLFAPVIDKWIYVVRHLLV